MEKNKFFKIKPTKDWGILWVPISMSRISTGQNVKSVYSWINDFRSKVEEPKVGINFTYCDFLYMNSSEPANKLKIKFSRQMINHKIGLDSAINKNKMTNQIQHAFHFNTFGNLYLESKGDFNLYFKKIQSLYQKDKLFQKYLKEDCKFSKRRLSKNQINFFLEECLMTYLILNFQIDFRNEYVQGREKWVIVSYPEVPLKTQVYLCQLNPFKFNIKNPYYGSYNSDNKKFYDFNNIDLETWNYK